MSKYTRKAIAYAWQDAQRKHLDPKTGFPAVVRTFPALSRWEDLKSGPSGRAEDQLRCALAIAAADYDHELATTFLDRATEVHLAASADKRWNSQWSPSRQIEHGRLLGAAIFAKAWRDDTDPDIPSLRIASNEIRNGATTERSVWTELAQSEYIASVELLLIAGDPASASKELCARTDFERITQYKTWLTRFIDMLNASDRSTLADHFDPFFDTVRHPFFKGESGGDAILGVPLLRLRLALIRWIYIERKPIAGNWRGIIGQIGY